MAQVVVAAWILPGQKAKEESGEKAAEVCRTADFPCNEVEGDLQKDDDNDIAKPLAGERSVAVAQEKTGPCPGDAHNATGGTDELHGLV